MRQDPLLPMDKEMLDSCLVTDDDQISDILHVYPRNRKVNQFNSEKLQKLDFPTIYIEAADLKTRSHGNRLRRKEPYSDRRSIVLPITLSLATGARVMLICNVDVHDGLANGVVGEITFISPHQTIYDHPQTIFVLFDHPAVGANRRKAEPPPSNIDSMCVAIHPHEEYINTSEMRCQYPLKLAWACTIHKTQGMTMKDVVVNLEGIFKEGMAYVALSRCTSLKGLRLVNYKPTDIFANKRIQEALDLMTQLEFPRSLQPLLLPCEDAFVVMFHNIQSLHAHMNDFRSNPETHQAHVIGLSETRISGTSEQRYSLDQYHPILHKDRAHGGVAFYVKKSVNYDTINLPNVCLDCLAIRISHPEMMTVVIYNKPKNPRNTFLRALARVMTSLPSNIHTVIGGDLNCNLFKEAIPPMNHYSQLIMEPTTQRLTLLDPIFVSEKKPGATAGLCRTYYSYHDPVFYRLPIKVDANCVAIVVTMRSYFALLWWN